MKLDFSEYNKRIPARAYCGYIRDEAVLMDSSSGGIGYAAAYVFLEKMGSIRSRI